MYSKYLPIQQFTNKGYVKVCKTTSTPSTPLRPLWTMTRVTRRTPTCATCRIEHTCTLSFVSSFDHSSFSTLRHSPHLHTIHDVRLSLSCSSSPSTSSFFFFHFLFLSFFLMSDHDDDSMTNNLRDSATVTFVTLDDSSHFTHEGKQHGGALRFQVYSGSQ